MPITQRLEMWTGRRAEQEISSTAIDQNEDEEEGNGN